MRRGTRSWARSAGGKIWHVHAGGHALCTYSLVLRDTDRTAKPPSPRCKRCEDMVARATAALRERG